MSSTATSGAAVVSPAERVEVLFEELAELAGQRNAIDGRIVEIVAELDRDGLWGVTGARSVAGLVAWKMGCSSGNAHTIATVARRLPEFPRCARGMREGRLSLDQVGVIAGRAGEGSDAHYAQLAGVATVNQLRTALKLEPRPEPEPDFRPEPRPSITRSADEQFSCWRIKLCVVRLSIATARVWFPVVGPPGVCTPTTSDIGRTVGPPSWPTWCWCARITTGHTIGA